MIWWIRAGQYIIYEEIIRENFFHLYSNVVSVFAVCFFSYNSKVTSNGKNRKGKLCKMRAHNNVEVLFMFVMIHVCFISGLVLSPPPCPVFALLPDCVHLDCVNLLISLSIYTMMCQCLIAKSYCVSFIKGKIHTQQFDLQIDLLWCPRFIL